MPRCAIVSAVHHKTNGAWRVAFAEHVCDLTVGHYPAARDTAHNAKHAFAILPIGLSFTLRHIATTKFAKPHVRARHRPRRQRSLSAGKLVRNLLAERPSGSAPRR